MRHDPRGDSCTSSPARRCSRCWSSATPTSTRPATTSRRSCEFKPTGLEGLDDLLVERHEEEGHPSRRTSRCCRQGGGWLLVEFGGESKDESDDKARTLMDRLKRRPNAAVDEALRRRGRGGAPVEGPRVGPGRDRPDPRRHGRLGGLGGLGRAARQASAPTSATSASCSRSTATTARSTATSARAASTRRIDFDLKTHEGVEHFRTFLDEAADLVVRYGGSLSGEHGDGQSQGGAACPRCSAPSWSRPSASSRRSGTRTTR